LTTKKTNPFPGGLLVLSARGEIIEAPQFFTDALRLEEREAASIYHLFDDSQLPYLSFERVLRRPSGIFEFYVSVVDDTDKQQGFRYWSVSPNQPNKRHSPITFYIVDESTLLQSQEWRRRRIRRDILNNARLSLSQYVRTRLSGVQALAELLRDHPQMAAETGERMVTSIQDIVASLDQLIDRYDMFSAPEGYVTIAEAAEIMSSWGEQNHQVDARFHGEDQDARLPTSYMEHILQPLVINALEASYHDEVVDVDIWELGNGFARIDVVDRGDGMNDYVRARAEDPFFTTKSGHLGLGLSQSWEALQTVGGQWRIESHPGDGTRITLLVPVYDVSELYEGSEALSEHADSLVSEA
jgi:signal transduction histidine kinase